ncbi:hypothetical protein [Desertivirga arenae]|uniref:hypothetical protein n=1 Tax=Desertivirga arenae TaxID=2810309 RepID=UPI001A95E6ED|nr:hypothetical protein [Pedobacter sp. SYSU D00823]
MAVVLAYTARIIIVNSTGLTDIDFVNSGPFIYEQDFNSKHINVDKSEPNVRFDADGISMDFVQPAKGKVTLVNIEDANQNRSYPINSGRSKDVSIPLSGLSVGQWKLKFEWESEGKSFLYEEDAFLK